MQRGVMPSGLWAHSSQAALCFLEPEALRLCLQSALGQLAPPREGAEHPGLGCPCEGGQGRWSGNGQAPRVKGDGQAEF